MKKLFKKIAIPVIATALLIPMLPNSVNAGHSIGLLNSKSMNIGADENTATAQASKATDGDHTTNSLLDANGGTYDVLWYELSSISTIDEYSIHASATTPNFTIVFYDSNGMQVWSQNYSSNANENITLSSTVSDVSKVAVINEGGGGLNLYEVDVYESTSTDSTAPGEVTNLTQSTDSGGNLGVSYTLPTDTDFSHLNIYVNGVQKVDETHNYTNTTWHSTNLVSGDVVKVSTVDTSGNESVGSEITLTNNTADTTAPGEVTSITATPGKTTVDLSWVNPSDSDFSHVNIERNGTTIATSVTGDVYSDSGLSEGTDYTYTLYTVDTSGNVSTGTSTTVTTDTTTDTVAPEAPSNVTGKALNKGAHIDWDSNTETDLNGYNIYKDGVKVNTSLVFSSHFNVGDLTNGQAYDFTVTAVDKSGNESVQSLAVTVTPDPNAMPPIETNYELQDVSDGVSNWFTELWMILAFAVGIPLAFLISNRIKGLFVG